MRMEMLLLENGEVVRRELDENGVRQDITDWDFKELNVNKDYVIEFGGRLINVVTTNIVIFSHLDTKYNKNYNYYCNKI